MKNKKLIYIAAFGIFLGLLIGAFALFLRNNQNSDDTVPQSPPSLLISASELSKHNTATDCWVVLGGVVYNATSTINNNPQYSSIISSVCGTDGYSVFVDQKYSESKIAQKDLPKLKDDLTSNKVGILAP